MNTPNSLKTQGSLLEQEKKSKTKSNLFLAIITILTLHVAIFSGLLIQGCKKDAGKIDLAADAQPIGATHETLSLDTNTLGTLPQMDTSAPPVLPAGQTPSQLMSNVTFVPPPVQPPPATPEPTPGLKEYIVAKGDSFYTIGKAHGVSMAAIGKANPNVDSRRLKVGQVLQIPAPASTLTAESPAAGEGAAMAVYSVKPGDTLTGIARRHGTTIKAIRAANKMKTDRLTVGQKLKIPAAKTPGSPPAPELAPAGTASAPVIPGGTPPVTLPLFTRPQ